MKNMLTLTPVTATITTALRNSGNGAIVLSPSVRVFYLNGTSYASIKQHGGIPQFYAMKGDTTVLEKFATPHEHCWNGYCGRVPPEGKCLVLKSFSTVDDPGFILHFVEHATDIKNAVYTPTVFDSVKHAMDWIQMVENEFMAEKEYYHSSHSFLLVPLVA